MLWQDFLTDRRMQRLESMTLSYTFFKSNEIYGEAEPAPAPGATPLQQQTVTMKVAPA